MINNYSISACIYRWRVTSLTVLLFFCNSCTHAIITNPKSTKSDDVKLEKPTSASNQKMMNDTFTEPQALNKKFTITGSNLPIRDVLLLMARDSDISLDVHPSIQAKITLHVQAQTMQQILQRICQQANLIYHFDNDNKLLVIAPDLPYLQHYHIDYVNIERDTKGGISVTNQLASAQSGLKNNAPTSTTTQQNNSTTTVNTLSSHHFWKSLVKNLEEILEETDKQTLIKRLEFDARLQSEFDSDIKQTKRQISLQSAELNCV